MNRLAKWAARLYPSAWRERYGAEFGALLEDSPPAAGDVWDILRGAFQMRATRLNFGAIILAFVLAGGLAAGVWSLTRPGYVSTGVLRIAGDRRDGASIAMQRAAQQAFSRASLSELIQRPSLDLYRADRSKLPLEDVIEKMRRDVMVRYQGFDSGAMTVTVSFRYDDPVLAQRTNDALIERLRTMAPATASLQVMEAASAAVSPAASQRWLMVGQGMLAGLTIGILCGALWTIVRNRQRWSLRRIGGFAAAGTAVGLTVSLMVPDVFISTAVLRTERPADASMLHRIMNDETLSGIIRRNNLYSSDQSMTEAVQRMRSSIRIQVATPTGIAPPDAYLLSFRDHDRKKAQAATRDLVSAWIEANLRTGMNGVVEVLDPPSDPVLPAAPNRKVIVAIGSIAGLLLGLAASRLHRIPVAAPVR